MHHTFVLQDISGAFRPNVLTAFMGETGAGKVRFSTLCTPYCALMHMS